MNIKLVSQSVQRKLASDSYKLDSQWKLFADRLVNQSFRLMSLLGPARQKTSVSISWNTSN